MPMLCTQMLRPQISFTGNCDQAPLLKLPNLRIAFDSRCNFNGLLLFYRKKLLLFFSKVQQQQYQLQVVINIVARLGSMLVYLVATQIAALLSLGP